MSNCKPTWPAVRRGRPLAPGCAGVLGDVALVDGLNRRCACACVRRPRLERVGARACRGTRCGGGRGGRVGAEGSGRAAVQGGRPDTPHGPDAGRAVALLDPTDVEQAAAAPRRPAARGSFWPGPQRGESSTPSTRPSRRPRTGRARQIGEQEVQVRAELECHGHRPRLISAQSFSVNAFVPSSPPRSPVRVSGRLTEGIDGPVDRLRAHDGRPGWFRRSASQSSSIAAERISEPGWPCPGPAMSGAEPCCACAMQCVVAGVDRAAEAEAAGQLRGLVGQDVAEHVGGDDHVEALRRRAPAAPPWRRRSARRAHVRDTPAATLRTSRRNRPSESLQHVGLVHGGHLAAALRASSKAASRDARASPCARDLAHGERDVRRRHELAGAREHVAVGVEALGVLAHDHEVHRRAAACGRPARDRHGRMLA